MPDIKHLLRINASPSNVFKAITETEGLSNWWTRQAKAKPAINSIAVFDFGDKYHNEMRITDLTDGKKVMWKCEVGDKEWVGTNIIFELSNEDSKTILKFSHSGWKEATEFFASCSYNWGWYLTSLKKYCETGKGTPFPDSLNEA